MRTDLPAEPPAERLHRRLSGGPRPTAATLTDPDDTSATHDTSAGAHLLAVPADRDQPADTGPDGDPTALLPRWLPEPSAGAVSWRDRLADLRADPGRAGAIGLTVVAVIAVLITIFTVLRAEPEPVVSAKLPPVQTAAEAENQTAQPSASAAPPGPVVVSVVGLVTEPGLVTLTPGARVADAISAAGGTVGAADTAGLNLAQPLTDGQQVVVGVAPGPGAPAVLGSSVSAAEPAGPGGRPATQPGPSRAPDPTPGEPVNLNEASAEQLEALPGIGPVMAAAIVAWRDANGRFDSVDQLGEVDGIGPARLAKLRDLVRV